MSAPSLHLYAHGLFSKYGFGDGDVLFDWIWDARDAGCGVDRFMDVSEHEVLRSLVRTHLVPLIPGEFTLYDIETNHNPIRVATWRGREWDDSSAEAPLEVADIVAVVPPEAVFEALDQAIGAA